MALSDFQQKVFDIVKKIPRGEARSYGWVAKKIGNPKLARAVGTALFTLRAIPRRGTKNTDPKKVSRHRAIRADGSIGGYRWGTRKKIRMLGKEGINLNILCLSIKYSNFETKK